MKRIIIDTNALMAIAEFKLDIFATLSETCDFPFRIYILKGTIDELEKIIKVQRARFQMAARIALALIKIHSLPIIKSSGNVDDALVGHSQQGDLVLTQDIALKRRLQKPYLTIRQKKKIIIIK